MNRRWLYLVPLMVIIAACDKEKEVDPPAQLVEFKPRIKVDEVWSTGLGGDASSLRLGLRPATDGQFLYAASHDGDVFAYELKSGRTKWRTDTKVDLSGGPGL